MPPRALLLDFAGTLATESPSRATIYAEAASARGRAIGEAEMGALMTRAHAELPVEVEGGYRYSDAWFRAFLERIFHRDLRLGRELLGDLEEELFARFSDAATFRLFPGVDELLERARRAGMRLAVVSNWSERLGDLLEDLGLARRFDAVLASATERLEKPDPALFRRAVDRLGVPAGDAVHAGDRLDLDVAGALAAGLRAVLVDRSGRMESEPRGAAARYAVVSSLPALADHLEELRA